MKAQLTAVLAILLVSHVASAQTVRRQSRLEMRGSAGWIGFPDEGMINHLLVGGSMRVAVTRRLGIEPEFTYMKGPRTDRDIVLSPVITYEFGSGRVRPYPLAAVGVLWHREGSWWWNSYHASGGFGVRTQINDHWSVSPEFRMGWYPHLQFKVAVGYRP